MDPRRRKNILLTLWLITPFLLIAGLLYAVAYWIQQGPTGGQKPPPVGAGAGETGGANAIGEMLSDDQAPPREAEAPPSEATGG